MTRWSKWGLGLAVAAGVTDGAWAQALPAAPPAAAAPAAVPVAAQPAMVPGAPGFGDVPPPVPGGMFGNLITGCDYLKFKWRQCLCNSVLGQLLNNMLAPAGAITGGLIPPLCPPNAVNPADLLKPADSAEGAAARIKADEADAKARAAALRYLGTVDCHYWPEAQAALINGLRADRNVCVRLAAAQALGSGCCCGPKTITALGITVAGTNDDGNPSETSECVRAAAFIALQRCVDRFPPPPVVIVPETPLKGKGAEPIPPPRGPEPVPPPKPLSPNGTENGSKPADKTGVTPAAYYQRVESLPMAQVVAGARRQLHDHAVVSSTVGAPHVSSSASQGLLGMAFSAISEPAHAEAEASASPTPPLAAQPTTEETGLTRKSSAPVPSPTTGTMMPTDVGGTRPPVLVPVPAGQPLPITPSASPARPSTGPVAPPRPPAPVSPPTPMPSVSAVPSPQPTRPVMWSSYDPVSPQAAGQPVVPAVAQVNSPAPPRQSALPPMTATPAPQTHTTPPTSPAHADPVPDERTARWVAVLREAPDPEARGWAASRLQDVNWRTHPEVVPALLRAAQKDTAPGVRTSCIRTLDHMDANTTTVLAILDGLRADRDPAVKQAAEEALRGMRTRRPQ